MKRFESCNTKIENLFVLRRIPISDERGYLERMYCPDDLAAILGDRKIKQINRTLTKSKGSLRGLHYQHPPNAELKIVNCIKGTIFDVAVDLRKRSPTFLHWHAQILSEKNHESLVIPEGFAHGFQTLSCDCELLYFHTEKYTPSLEGGINALDPTLHIDWPLPESIRSQRDLNLPDISEFEGIVL